MSAAFRRPSFQTANPHALATILDASQTRSIIASRDIFDISGTKLWARDQPVSHALQRKLLDRQLRHPLESCLMVEDGVTVHTLAQVLGAMIESSTADGATPAGGAAQALRALLRPHAARLQAEVTRLPLHPVAQLLLTAGQATRPASFEHAVQAMALNGALALGHGGTTADLRLAMLCGLLHDLGEMYIDPKYGEADADRALDFQSYQHLVVHPHVGDLLVAQLTDYPSRLARAIAEHHERLDGSGYPHGLQREQVSPQGRLLAITEATLGALRGEQAHLARVSVALRVVPGEFDLAWIGPIVDAARAQPAPAASRSAGSIAGRLAALDETLLSAQAAVEAVVADREAKALHEAAGLAQHLLARLRTGWNASGLWSDEVLRASDAAEVQAIEDELRWRLRAIARAAKLRAGTLPPEAEHRLQRLCEGFEPWSC